MPDMMSVSLTRMLPGLFQKTPFIVDDMTPFSHAGMLLAVRQIDFIPVHVYKMSSEGHLAHVIGRFAGFSVVKALRVVKSPEILKKPVKDFVETDLGLVPPTSHLLDLLDAMIRTRFGHACVSDRNELVATVSLKDLIQYAPSIGLNGDITVGEVASQTISLPRETKLSQLLDALVEKRIRRVVVEGLEETRIVDDRVVAQYAFSYEGLRTMRNNPHGFYDRPLYSIPLLKPGQIGSDATLAEAWETIYANRAECLLVDEGEKILTPWDIVIKPYLKFKRAASPPRPSLPYTKASA